jgi:hypothetical protein
MSQPSFQPCVPVIALPSISSILDNQLTHLLPLYQQQNKTDFNTIEVGSYHPLAYCCRHNLPKNIPILLQLGAKVKGLNLLWYKTYLKDQKILKLVETKIIEEEPEVWAKHEESKRKDGLMKTFRDTLKREEEFHKKREATECIRCFELFYSDKHPFDESQPKTKAQIDSVLNAKSQEIYGVEIEKRIQYDFLNFRKPIEAPNVCRFHFGKHVCKDSGRGYATTDTFCCSNECCKLSGHHPGCCEAPIHVTASVRRCKVCGIYEDVQSFKKCIIHAKEYHCGWRCCGEKDFQHPGCIVNDEHEF